MKKKIVFPDKFTENPLSQTWGPNAKNWYYPDDKKEYRYSVLFGNDIAGSNGFDSYSFMDRQTMFIGDGMTADQINEYITRQQQSKFRKFIRIIGWFDFAIIIVILMNIILNCIIFNPSAVSGWFFAAIFWSEWVLAKIELNKLRNHE